MARKLLSIVKYETNFTYPENTVPSLIKIDIPVHIFNIYKPGKDILLILYYTCKKICPNIENTTRAHHRTCNTHKISGACKVNVHIFWAAKNIAYNTFRNFGTSDHLQTYRK